MKLSNYKAPPGFFISTLLIHQHFLVLEVYALDAVAYRCQYLIRYSIQCVAEYGYRQVITEDFHRITFLTVDTGNIYHGYVHTDISNILRFLSVDKTVTVAVSQMTVQTISIANRYCSYNTVVVYLSLTAVAYSISLRHVAHLQNSGLKS